MLIERLVILGAGGHAKVVLDAARSAWPAASIEMRDDDLSKHASQLLGVAVTVPIGDLDTLPADSHVAIGNNAVRRRLGQALLARKKQLCTVPHPRATVSGSAYVADGTFLAAGVVVAPNAQVGIGVILNHGSVVDHDCCVGAWTHIAPGVVLGGEVRVGEACMIGSGAIVLPGVEIGDEATIGAGAVVTHDVPPGMTVVGVPARKHTPGQPGE